MLTPTRNWPCCARCASAPLYRADQHSYLLYPDVDIPSFLKRNTITTQPPIDDPRIFSRDSHGEWHFQADLQNAIDLAGRLDSMKVEGPAREPTLDLWEKLFRHASSPVEAEPSSCSRASAASTGHMVSKLLLAVQECYEAAIDPEAGGRRHHRRCGSAEGV